MQNKFRMLFLFFISLFFASNNYCSLKSDSFLKILSFFCPCCKKKTCIVPVSGRNNYYFKKNKNSKNKLLIPEINVSTSADSLNGKECDETKEGGIKVDLDKKIMEDDFVSVLECSKNQKKNLQVPKQEDLNKDLSERKLERIPEGRFFRRVKPEGDIFCFKTEINIK